MLATLHQTFDSIPYPITVGCIGIFPITNTESHLSVQR